ncbi:MAG: cyclic nucleotide-binding domain-containing protein [Verrucomicrobiota bacterium]|jgi:signal transduction histidine kinase
MVLLESNKLFCDLGRADLERLREVTRELNFAANQIIFKEGDAGDGVYFVKDGLVQIQAVMAHGESKALGRIPPGELFGEMAVLDNQPRSATAMAEEPTTVYFIGRGELDQLLDHTPMLAAVLVREVSLRLRQFTRQYVREVLEAERLGLVGRFASSIVHDLKNPLNIIGISADMAAMPTATPESRQTSTVRIRKQVERISIMVNELLEFTQGSHTNVVMALIGYKSYVEQLIDEIRPEIAIKSVTLEYLNPPPSVVVRIDPQRLSRVFHNLIANAADAMTTGGTVKLSFCVNEKEIITRLQDTGKGIAPEIMDRLFQAFATYGKSNGTGLGLSICKKIVHDHHGRMQARNVPGGGALFEFSLPLPT